MNIIQTLEKERMKETPPKFNVGDTVRVFSKITEGDKERLAPFEGIIIKAQGGGLREAFTVRRLVQGVGVERTFFVHSPKLDSIKLVRTGKVRRAKLHYLRKRIGSAATKIEEGTVSAESQG